MYPEIKVKYINGKNPDLVLENGEVIDLTHYKTTEDIHKMLNEKGFDKKESKYSDDGENCFHWARMGECVNNPEYMSENCKYSCYKIEL
mgnify:FL=1